MASRRRETHQPGRDPVGLQVGQPALRARPRLAHRHPDVGVDGAGAGDGLARVLEHGGRRPRCSGSGRYPSGQASRRSMPVSVAASISEWATLLPSPTYATGQPAEVAEALAQREQVGERLARVMVVGQRVDDRHARGGRHLLDVALRERADDDRRAVGGHHARGVGDRLAAPELELVGPQHDRQAAEPVHGGLERDARARGRLGEVARHGGAGERVVPAVRVLLHRRREVEQRGAARRG